MSLIETIAVALALAMDAFAVSVAIGAVLQEVSARQTFRLSWHFGLFQALMPILGWAAGQGIQAYIAEFDHWVAFGLLSLIGGRMILGAIQGEEEKIKDSEPTRGLSLVLLSVATSIDALAVGLSLALIGVSIWFTAFIIGIVTGALTAGGIHIGGYVGRRLSIARYAELLGGVVLLIIGGRILHAHGVF